MAFGTTAALIGAGLGIGGGLLNRRKRGQSTSSSTSNSTATQTNAYDPFGLSAYQGLQPQVASTLSDFMSDPWKAGWFQNAMTKASEATGQRAGLANQNLFNQALLGTRSGGDVATGAISNPNAFFASEQARIGRQASRERADTLTNLLLDSQGLRMGAANAAAAYRPLQTGATTTSSGTQSGTQQQGGGSFWGDILGLGGNVLMGLPGMMGGPTWGASGVQMPGLPPGFGTLPRIGWPY